MRIKALKMIVFVEDEATPVNVVGGKKIVSSVVHLLSKNAMHLHTRTTKMTLRLLFPSRQETLSTYV